MSSRNAVNIVPSLGYRARRAVRYGVERGIAAQPESATVNLVGAGLGSQADCASGAVPDVRVNGILLYCRFLNRVRVGNPRCLVADSDRAAIHLQVILESGSTAQVHAVRSPTI